MPVDINIDCLYDVIPEIKDQILSFIPISTLKGTNRLYFEQYMRNTCNNLVRVRRVDTYIRNVIKHDGVYVLREFIRNCPRSISNRRVLYRSKNMLFIEYVNTLTHYYGANRCKECMVDIFR